MEPIHRIAPRPPDVAPVPPVTRQPIGPEERERKRRERELAREHARRRAATRPEPPVDGGDDERPRIDLTA